MMGRERTRKCWGFVYILCFPPVFSLRPGQRGLGSHCERLFHSTFIAVMEIHCDGEPPSSLISLEFHPRRGQGGWRRVRSEPQHLLMGGERERRGLK